MSKELALKLVKYRHEKALAERDVRILALRKDELFCTLEQNLDTLQWEHAKNVAYDIADMQVLEKIALAQQELVNYFIQHNLPTNCLDVKTYCNICSDTGIIDGKLCKCAENIRIKLVIEAFPQLENLPFALKDIDFNFYNGKKDFYKKCSSFIEKNFFEDDKSFLTIMGGTGVGKTYLALVAIKQALQKGKTINIINTIALNKIFLEYHCAPLSEKNAIWKGLMNSDLMLIDDLGVEQIFNNVTLPYLYELMVERLGKQTIFTTNMELRDLEAKYGQRILSRLCDKRNSSILPIYSQDLRFD